ncbi:MAG: radical SAM protein [Lentisphaeria bacterium]|nr:radical SAM protein [Lentisphaeria bacterium]
MIGISKLYCGAVAPSDVLRYGGDSAGMPARLLQFAREKKPVVVWNVGRRCNLRCAHCYSQSRDYAYSGELTRREGFALIDDLAGFGVPVILFSGGEPLMRPDIMDLIARARAKGVRAVLSTNGTLITEETAARLKDAGLSYVGVSLDGLGETNDTFRGVPGAFDLALRGIRACLAAGVKVGLRFTISAQTAPDIGRIFDLIEREGIPRVCFYHLVYAGRGAALRRQDLDHDQTRAAVDLILDRTRAMAMRGDMIEVLTVDNHCDGPHIYLRLLRENPDRAAAVLELLKMNGGNSSGHGIGCVSWDGEIFPDQFWRNHSLGNVRKTPFSRVWSDETNECLASLRARGTLLEGRCAACKWLDICNGNLRARAEAVTGNMWGSDPACYLTDEEIGR